MHHHGTQHAVSEPVRTMYTPHAHGCAEQEQSGFELSQASSTGDQHHPAAEDPSANASSSNGGGFWQREIDGAQQSGTGTWDFDTGPDHEPEQATESSSAPSSDKQMLYIQMEFCPRTLKKTLVAGPIEEAGAWQVAMIIGLLLNVLVSNWASTDSPIHMHSSCQV